MIPIVSIIMPCLNGERHIQATIDSVLVQTFNDFELIVVDNGSTDRTSEILGSVNDPRLRVLTLPERGVSRARNLGLREARGAFIAFLDSDDTWSAEFLEKMHMALASDSKVVLAYCGWQNLGLPGLRGEPFVPPDYENPGKTAALLEGCRWPIHACLTRHAAIVQAGGFNTQLTIAEDYLLWMEVSAIGSIIRVPEVLAQYRHHNGLQATHNLALAALDTFRAKEMFLRRHPQIVRQLGPGKIESLTWDKLIQQGNALHWQGDLKNVRPIFRKTLLTGHGSLSAKLRMLPSLLPLSVHRAILAAKKRFNF
ncbi:glycosyltransferase [Candidatus Nitrotoga arctica]|uniref:Glycosyl transferase family 2 n=1 Tax=Candidatus Nitrotoga arctica TaxID=453162 RepID=A0ABN8AR01_9PROT|nr:glycosyltransferase [Candidatus Nitrotoga arctica]CAG9932785.1 Glycosyl transferase family 2 [Candidatus Nitrotoga arctica]